MAGLGTVNIVQTLTIRSTKQLTTLAGGAGVSCSGEVYIQNNERLLTLIGINWHLVTRISVAHNAQLIGVQLIQFNPNELAPSMTLLDNPKLVSVDAIHFGRNMLFALHIEQNPYAGSLCSLLCSVCCLCLPSIMLIVIRYCRMLSNLNGFRTLDQVSLLTVKDNVNLRSVAGLQPVNLAALDVLQFSGNGLTGILSCVVSFVLFNIYVVLQIYCRFRSAPSGRSRARARISTSTSPTCWSACCLLFVIGLCESS